MTVPRFWREIPHRYRIIGSRCGVCGSVDFPPRAICPSCRRKSIGKMTDIPLSQFGKIVSYSVIHSTMEGFENQSPMVMAIIKLDDGPMLTAQIVNGEAGIGKSVRAVFRRIQEDGRSGIIYYGYKFEVI